MKGWRDKAGRVPVTKCQLISPDWRCRPAIPHHQRKGGKTNDRYHDDLRALRQADHRLSV